MQDKKKSLIKHPSQFCNSLSATIVMARPRTWLLVTSLIVLAEAMKAGQTSRRGALSSAFGSAPNKAAAAEERAKGRGSWSSTPRIGSGSRQQLRLAPAGNSSGLADFVCSPDEQYAGVLRAEASGELQSKAAAIVQLPDGTLLTLSRDAASNRGTSSIRFSNAKFVLKLAKQASSLSAALLKMHAS